MRAIEDIQSILVSHSNLVQSFDVKRDGNRFFIQLNAQYPHEKESYERLESIILQIQWHIIDELQQYKDMSFVCNVTLFESDVSWQKEFCMDEDRILHVHSRVHPFFLQFDNIIKQVT